MLFSTQWRPVMTFNGWPSLMVELLTFGMTHSMKQYLAINYIFCDKMRFQTCTYLTINELILPREPFPLKVAPIQPSVTADFHFQLRKGSAWWRHQMETFSALLAICAGNSPVTDEFLAQRPVTRSFDVFFDLRLNKRLSKQSWGWWFETLSSPLWRHCNGLPNVGIT